MNFWWFYILRCGDGRYYYGSTGNLRRRLIEHHKGMVSSTNGGRAVKLVYFEVFKTASKARLRERWFKRNNLHKREVEVLIKRFNGFELSATALPRVKS